MGERRRGRRHWRIRRLLVAAHSLRCQRSAGSRLSLAAGLPWARGTSPLICTIGDAAQGTGCLLAPTPRVSERRPRHLPSVKSPVWASLTSPPPPAACQRASVHRAATALPRAEWPGQGVSPSRRAVPSHRSADTRLLPQKTREGAGFTGFLGSYKSGHYRHSSQTELFLRLLKKHSQLISGVTLLHDREIPAFSVLPARTDKDSDQGGGGGVTQWLIWQGPVEPPRTISESSEEGGGRRAGQEMPGPACILCDAFILPSYHLSVAPVRTSNCGGGC